MDDDGEGGRLQGAIVGLSWGFLGRLESDGVQAVGEAASLGRCERRSLGSWETKASAARRDRGIDQLRCDTHMQMVITAAW